MQTKIRKQQEELEEILGRIDTDKNSLLHARLVCRTNWIAKKIKRDLLSKDIQIDKCRVIDRYINVILFDGKSKKFNIYTESLIRRRGIKKVI